VTISVYLPLLLSVLLSALSRPLAHRLSPRTVTPALVTATVLVAAASTWGLVLLAATLLQQAPEVTEHAVGLISFTIRSQCGSGPPRLPCSPSAVTGWSSCSGAAAGSTE